MFRKRLAVLLVTKVILVKGSSGGIEPVPLTTFDVRRIIEICEWDLHLAEWLYDGLKWTKARQQYVDHLYLSARIMRTFKNGRDADKKYVPRLVGKRILKCTRRIYEIGECCRIWQVNWKFSRKGKIVPKDLSFREALCLVTTLEEIKAHYAWTTAWRINRLRKKLADLEFSDAWPSATKGSACGAAYQRTWTSKRSEQTQSETTKTSAESHSANHKRANHHSRAPT